MRAIAGTKDVAPPLALPTNAWYQNLLMAKGEPTQEQRAYTVPYIVDLIGPIPGMRIHHPTVQGGTKIIQLTEVEAHGLTLGAATRNFLLNGANPLSKKYAVTKMTPLGVTLEWVSTSYFYYCYYCYQCLGFLQS